MLTFAAVMLGLAVLGGAGALGLRLRGGNPPLGLAFAHGTIAAVGLIALAAAVIRDGLGGAPAVALGILVTAALGGFALVALHLRGRLLPLPLVLGHGVLAIAGYAVLLAHLWG